MPSYNQSLSHRPTFRTVGMKRYCYRAVFERWWRSAAQESPPSEAEEHVLFHSACCSRSDVFSFSIMLPQRNSSVGSALPRFSGAGCAICLSLPGQGATVHFALVLLLSGLLPLPTSKNDFVQKRQQQVLAGLLHVEMEIALCMPPWCKFPILNHWDIMPGHQLEDADCSNQPSSHHPMFRRAGINLLFP